MDEGSIDRVDRLLQWAKRNGTTLDNRVEVYQDAVTGLSFRATADIQPGMKIAISSPTTSLSYLNATESLCYSRHKSPPFPPEFLDTLHDQPHIIGNFFLMQQYLLGEDSFWAPYISTLPQPDSKDELPTPIWWPEEDTNFLDDTNAALAMEQKDQIWYDDYNAGIRMLRARTLGASLDVRLMPFRFNYTWHLYKWAATIFGTRSFRPSLTTSWSTLSKTEIYLSTRNSTQRTRDERARRHVINDDMSILFPVIDIGNHSGENQVVWSANSSHQFSLATTGFIAKGSQIYNFYGHKSNSELLVGYGFILEDNRVDSVNIKVRLHDDPLVLRQSQTCHKTLQQSSKPEEEWMFKIHRLPVLAPSDGLTGFRYFSHGLAESLSCCVANERERRFLLVNPDYCLESEVRPFSCIMTRNLIEVMSLLYDKLKVDFEKIRAGTMSLQEPYNSNQDLALRYRNSQSQVLENVIMPYEVVFQILLQHNSFCSHPQHSVPPTINSPARTLVTDSVELLLLGCAYDWLHRVYPDIYTPLAAFVSEYEEEPNPPRWQILAKDFGNVYWTIWIFIVLVLDEERPFRASNPHLSQWLGKLHDSYLEELDHADHADLEYGDTQENETILEVMAHISLFPRLESIRNDEISTECTRNFAKFIAFQETIALKVKSGKYNFEGSSQRVLCMTKEPLSEN